MALNLFLFHISSCTDFMQMTWYASSVLCFEGNYLIAVPIQVSSV
jgi:hypothetical protein